MKQCKQGKSENRLQDVRTRAAARLEVESREERLAR